MKLKVESLKLKVGIQETGNRRKESGMRANSRLVICGLILTVLIAALSLAGCGGGGGGGKGGGPTPPGAATINNVIGVGVIMQSRGDLSISSTGGKTADPVWKRIDLRPGIFHSSPTRMFRSAGITLNEHATLILLAWDQVSGADHYQVSYQGSQVWDSADTDRSDPDPAFQAENPQAYLDFDDELKNLTLAAGRYEFQITALSGSTVLAQSPTVTASLGLVLQTLPVVGPNLSWSAVAGASEYRINIPGINPVTVDSNTTSYDAGRLLTASTPARQYDIYLDARALDGNGYPLEIARGIGGLSY